MSKKLSITLSILLLFSLFPASTANAVPEEFLLNDIRFYKEECTPDENNGSSSQPPSGTAVDYKGREIYSSVQMELIKNNQSFYEKSAKEVGIPWQMIAVIHIRESGGSRNNPANGQGVYQFVNKNGGPYPHGPIDDTEFQRQTDLAAKFILSKAGDKADQLKNGDDNAVKYTFFAYNGIAKAYINQAKKLGFSDEEAANGEGSPYVMNKADEKREPSSTWGQIKADGGGLEYPANKDHGAFVAYTALKGGTTSVCGTPKTGNFVIYYQEDPKWKSHNYPNCGDVEKCGCGPTSLAMIISTLKKDSSITPDVITDKMAEKGQTTQEGASWAAFTDIPQTYGLKVENIGTDISKIKQALREGKYVITSQDPGIFTGSGHIIALRGLTSDGRILVGDPNGHNTIKGNQACSAGSGKCTTLPKNASEMNDVDGNGKISYSENTAGFSDEDISGALKGAWVIGN